MKRNMRETPDAFIDTLMLVEHLLEHVARTGSFMKASKSDRGKMITEVIRLKLILGGFQEAVEAFEEREIVRIKQLTAKKGD